MAQQQNKKALTERDICTKYITPALKQAGWDDLSQIREEVFFTLRIAANRILHEANLNRSPEKNLSIAVNHNERISVKTKFDGSLQGMSLNSIRATIALVEHLSH